LTGYSTAFVGVGGEWWGIEAQAMEDETTVIGFDPKAQSQTELPSHSADTHTELFMIIDQSSLYQVSTLVQIYVDKHGSKSNHE